MALGSYEKERNRKGLFIIIALLLVVNALLIYFLTAKRSELRDTNIELAETEETKIELQNLLNDSKSELGEYKLQNASLDSIILVRNEALEKRINTIKQLISSDRISKSALQQAKKQIADLKRQLASFTSEIDSLSRENKYLKDENYVMQQAIIEEQTKNANLSNANRMLEDKVDLASKMRPLNLEGSAVRKRSNGSYKPISKLKRADQLLIKFTLAKNEVAEQGPKVIYLKLMSPSKETIYNEAIGSGKFIFRGEESLYTDKVTINFENKNERVTFAWPVKEYMIAGEYEAILFSENHLIGKTSFSVK